MRYVVGCLMVTGMLLTPISTNAEPVDFGSKFVLDVEPMSFGYFKKVPEDDVYKHVNAIATAVLYADTGETVQWNGKVASGFTEVLYSKPTAGGFCRTIYTVIRGYDRKVDGVRTYCWSESQQNWFNYEP